MLESTAKTKKKNNNAKPEGFKEYETLAKEILDASGDSYFDWLHQKHQSIILDFNLNNISEVASLAKGEV